MTESGSARIDTSEMAAVHMVFRRSFASAPDLIASAANDEDRRSLIANYYANILDFLQVHHDGEEHLLFPLLAERAAGRQTLVETVADQHEEVLVYVDALKERVGAWQSVGDSEVPELLEVLRALETALSPHLDQEEAELLPLAGEHLTAEEWGQLPAHGMMNFKGDKIWLILGLIRENLTEDQRNLMLTKMPPPARQMWADIGESSFNNLMAQVRLAR